MIVKKALEHASHRRGEWNKKQIFQVFKEVEYYPSVRTYILSPQVAQRIVWWEEENQKTGENWRNLPFNEMFSTFMGGMS